MSIVNGAQTVLSSASVENISDQALVQVRIIEASEGASQNNNLSLMITKFNNSQNSVSAMDLRTLDPIHIEIKKFFIKHGQYYFYKTGETQNKAKYITFEDLMISLGCFYEQSQTVKQNKGELWSNTKLYNDLLKTKDLQLYLLLCLGVPKRQLQIVLQNAFNYTISREIKHIFTDLKKEYRQNKVCAICGSKENLQIHHIKPIGKNPYLK